MLLEIMGNEVGTAYDGEQAVETAEAMRPDVVLLDIGMPKLNGYDACRRIREQPWGQGMFLIALTGWGQEEDRRRTEEAGFNRHVVKPVDPTVLMKLLASLSRSTEAGGHRPLKADQGRHHGFAQHYVLADGSDRIPGACRRPGAVKIAAQCSTLASRPYSAHPGALARQTAAFVDRILRWSAPRGPADRTPLQVRPTHQSQDRQGPRPDDSTDDPPPG